MKNFRKFVLPAGTCCKTLQIVVIVLCVLTMSSSALAARARPHFDTSLGFKRLLSDNDTLLRGVSLSWDGGDPYGSNPKVMPSQASLNALATDYGLNTVHLFLEGDSTTNTNPVGYNAADCDTLVQRCATAGLYLIITIGCNGENGSINVPYSQDFWDFYAPRYANNSHVIYELHNEPVAYTAGHWDQTDWDNQVAVYNHIRPNASNTLILMFTFQGLNNPTAAINGINYLEANGVDWSKAAVAWHGYTALNAIEDVLDALEQSPSYPATLCTEFWPGDTEGQGYNSAFESHFTGWMQFQWLTANDADLTSFKFKIETAGTVWTPELGSWPTESSPAIPTNGSSVGIFDRGQAKFVGVNAATGDLRADLANYTGSQDDEFIVGNAGTNLVSFRASNGQYVSTTGEADPLTPNSSSVGDTERFHWYELPNAEVVLRSIGSGHLLNSKNKQGKLVILPDADNASDVVTNYAFVDGTSPSGPPPAPGDPPEPDPGPYYGTPMGIPGVIEAEDFDYGGEGVAYHDTDAGNTGGVYRPTEDVDLEACSEGGVNVGWIANGEWMEYTVDVQTAGTYTIDTRYAGGNSSFHIEFDGVDKTGSVATTETGGWQVWSSKQATVSLSAGVQIMRFVGSSGFNLNKFTFTSGGGGSYCGDGTCDAGEDPSNCPADCGGGGACNNNGVCETGEDCTNCANDCIGVTGGNPNNRYCCGDGTCEGAETSSNCGIDCGGGGAVCGDGTCEGSENSNNCPDDCGPPAQCNDDGTCDPGEDCTGCPGDCDGVTGGRPSNRYCCGNGTLESPQETSAMCDGNP